MDSSATKVTDNPEEHRFELTVDGRLAGHVEYRLLSDAIVFTHTEVDPAFNGRGLGSVLARAVLDSARERELAVVAQCPFIRRWIEKHPDYADLVSDSASEEASGA